MNFKALYHRHVRKGRLSASPSRRRRSSWFLATGKRYAELDTDYITRRCDRDSETRCLIAKLEALGHRVTLRDAAA